MTLEFRAETGELSFAEPPAGVEDKAAEADQVFLRPEVKMEPLVCGWYAWIHLVSPAQHALNVLNRHIPLMQSFIKNPAAHVTASADPTLFGGPFMDVAADQVGQVRELLADTEARCAKLLTWARDFRQFDRELQESAKGYSLSDFYARLPQSMLGLAEVLYDLNNHPKVRLHEELMYEVDLAAGTRQIMLSLVPEQKRRFFMSTPRLKSSENLILDMDFADRRLDLIASMRTRSRSRRAVARELGVRPEQEEFFDKLWTTAAPHRDAPEYHGSGVRVRYFGHACVLLQTAEISILIDPMLAWDNDKGDGRYTFCDLPDWLDYVVISHNHQDHCAPEMLIPLRHRVGEIIVPGNNRGCLADPSMKLALRKLGFEKVSILEPFDSIPLPEGQLISLPFPGEHVDLDIYSRHGIHVELKGRRFTFLVDSDGCDRHLFRRVAARVGKKADALFIGMECHGAPLSWLYGPLLTKPITRGHDESRRLSGLNCERARSAVEEFDPQRVLVYAMGQEPWLTYIMGLAYKPDSIQLREAAALLEYCRSIGIPAEKPFIHYEMEFDCGTGQGLSR
jgi:L-ascorbate metabolism protein UlaG (beta-lactamase superfamily)